MKIGQTVIKFTEFSNSYTAGGETRTSVNFCLKTDILT